MGVSVLGPVAVDGDADEAALAPRDRVVLAALAMSPRQVVSPDRLADALWEETPPTTWTKVVQGSVMRIRKVLGADAVRTARQGYVLDLADEEIDALRFERLVRRGRELLSLDEPDRARYALNQALDLWYGPALSDLEGWSPGEAAARHWEELRRDAEELRVEAALAAGEWREVLTDAGRLVAEQPYRENRWALLARAQYHAGRQAEALATLQRARAVLAGELGLDPGPELAALEDSILHQDPDLLPDPDDTGRTHVCPYRGLLHYDVDDSELYFGRNADVAACRDALVREHVVAVVGPSGSGKSSLVRAGVAAALRREGRSVSVMTPGAHPMASLERAGGLHPRGVLVVDQLEEVATLCEDPAERAAFLDALARHRDDGTDLVLALRADRLGAFSGHHSFARVVERGIHLLGAMDEDDLRSAVEGPARQAGLLLEPGLVDLLVQEVAGETGALPLLSHALVQTWERREGRTLTVAGYRASGGIETAVARSAEAVFLALDEADRRTARSMLLRLVVPVASGEPTRSRVPRRVVASDASHEVIVETLVAARLVTSDGETVELAHESLARAWPRLRGWLDADTEGQLILRHLAAAADSWDAMGRPDSELYRGTRLARALEWSAGAEADLTETEREFLLAGDSLARAEARSAQERLVEQTRSNRRLRGLLAGVVGLLALALVAGVLALREGDRADRQAAVATVRELAAASRAARADDPQLALLLALEATSPDLVDGGRVAREAEEALHLAVVSNRLDLVVEGAGGAVAWSPDGRFLATEGPEDSGLVEVLDAETGETTLSFEGHEIDVNDVAFGPDGQLATTGDDGALRVWDPEDGTLLAEQEGEGEVWSPTFSTEGRPRVAAVWRDLGLIQVIDIGAGDADVVAEVRVPAWVGSANLEPDGTSMVVVAGGEVRVLDARTGDTQRRLGRPADLRSESPVRARFSPDGAWVAVGTLGDARIFDATTGDLSHTLDQVAVLDLAWSRDSARLAVSEEQGEVQVYEVTPEAARPSIRLPGTPGSGGVYGLAFSPDGTRLLGGDRAVTSANVWDLGHSGDAEVRNVRGTMESHGVDFGSDGRLFTVGEGASVRAYDEGGEPVPLGLSEPEAGEPLEFRAIDVAPDGTAVALGLSPSGARVWDLSGGELRFSTGDIGYASRPAFSPDGEHVAVVIDNGVLSVRDLDGEVQEQLRAEPGHELREPVFSPDGRTVAAVSFGAEVEAPPSIVLWDWQADEVRQLAKGEGFNPQFSPDGRRLAIASRPSRVLDVASGEVVHTLEGHDAGVVDLAWSPDGRRIATAGRDGVTMLWDAADGSQLLALPPSEHEVSSVAFSPDGRHLATDSFATDVVRVWALDVAELREIAEGEAVRDFTPAECRRHLHRACDAG